MTVMTKIDLPYIEVNRSRHHRERYYVRINGKRLGRLPDNPHSQAFVEAYWAIRNNTATTPVAGPSVHQGTFGWLYQMYLQSGEYKRLDDTTCTKRRQIIGSMLAEPLTRDPVEKRRFGDIPIAALTMAHVEVLRDRKEDTPFAADERLKILRQVLETKKPGSHDRFMRENVARLVRPFRKKTDGHHTLRREEAIQYITHHGIGSNAVLGLMLLLYTGMRVSDLSSLDPQHLQGDWFRFRVFKNRNTHPTELSLPVHPTLSVALAGYQIKGLTYMLTEQGRPFSIKGLGKRVSDWFTQAGLEDCSAHSVRKGLATNLAECEATDSMLDGMFGWKDGKTSKIYTTKKEQSKLAHQAVLKINWGEIENILPHPVCGSVPDCHTSKKEIAK